MVDLKNLIYQSFKNEIELEKHLASKLPNSRGFFPFKVSQFSSFFLKPNYYYKASIILLCITVFLFQFITGFLFYFLFLFRCIISQRPPKNIIVSSIKNRNLINDAIKQLNLPKNDFFYINLLSLILNVKKDRLLKYLFFLIGYTRYIIINSNECFVLLLNYKDILNSYLLTVYILDNPGVIVLTEDHYQRSAFIISKLQCKKFVIVQHGFIDDSIKFSIQFGKIDHLILRDINFLKSFKTYYKVDNYGLLLRNIDSMFLNKNLVKSCFLASSSPFIDFEIKFAKLFKSKYNFKLIVKKHPRHIYNREKLNTLLSLTDEQWIDEFLYPNSCLFISHSSFLEFDYLSAGSFTFKLSDYSDIENIFEDPGFKNAISFLEKL
jgi:hypothetical protein